MALTITNYFGTTNTTALANRTIAWIVCHYTAGTTSKKGSALNLASCYKAGSLVASSDFTVDDATVIQYNRDIKNRYTWGVGGKRYPSMSTSLGGRYYGICTNKNCINIEVCSNKVNRKSLEVTDTDWYFTDSELDLTAQLIAKLMKDYNIDIDHVIMHHEVTGKWCPAMWTQNESQLVNWYNFKKKVESYYGSSSSSSSNSGSSSGTTEKPGTYEVVKEIKGYSTAADALAGVNAKTTLKVGTYYEYKSYNGAINISKTSGVAGSWINPADNVKEEVKEAIKPSYDYPQIKLGTAAVRVKSVKKSGNTLVTGNKTFTYGQFACPGDDMMLVIKALPVALETLKDFMNMSSIKIVRGYLNDEAIAKTDTSYACTMHKRHKNGFAADIICYDKSGKIIPAKYVCCAAQLLGFTGIAVAKGSSTVLVHLDVKSSSLWAVQGRFNDKDIRKNGYADFFDYFDMDESDLNKYTGLDIGVTKATEVKISEENPSATIIGEIKAPKEKIVAYIKKTNPNFDSKIADAFYEIGKIYGVRGDIALCQSIVETGYFKYEGSAVTADQHNYCGLGVTSNGVKGCTFATIEQGVEAQIQHLYAYGSTKDIPAGRTLYDPRFKYVTRGIAPVWGALNMRWAMTNIYGQTIISVYNSAIK